MQDLLTYNLSDPVPSKAERKLAGALVLLTINEFHWCRYHGPEILVVAGLVCLRCAMHVLGSCNCAACVVRSRAGRARQAAWGATSAGASCHGRGSMDCGKMIMSCTTRIVHQYRGSWRGMPILCWYQLEVRDALALAVALLRGCVMALGRNARWNWGRGISGLRGRHCGITGQLGAFSRGIKDGGMMGGITGSRRGLDSNHWSKMMPGMKGLCTEKIFHRDVYGRTGHKDLITCSCGPTLTTVLISNWPLPPSREHITNHFVFND